jgi:hypothetical protein
MEYQLVIKFWRKSLQDEAFLTSIESDLKEVLGDASFDGYDVSAEEINLFVIVLFAASKPCSKAGKLFRDFLRRHGWSAACNSHRSGRRDRLENSNYLRLFRR